MNTAPGFYDSKIKVSVYRIKIPGHERQQQSMRLGFESRSTVIVSVLKFLIMCTIIHLDKYMSQKNCCVCCRFPDWGRVEFVEAWPFSKVINTLGRNRPC